MVFGVGPGAITPSRAAIVAECYGVERYGRIHGVLGMVMAGARALSPVAVGIIAGASDGYRLAFVFLAALLIVAAFSLWMAGRPNWDTQVSSP